MTKMKTVFLTALLALSSTLATAASIEGNWQTVYEDGKPKATVRISRAGNTFVGTIVGVAKGVDPNCAICKEPGPLAGRKILWGLQQDSDNEYSGGQIHDPKNGKTYKAKAEVQGNTLHLRGYVGVSLLGRTQVWRRM